MPDQALDPALERDGRGRAARAGAVHRQVKVPVAITLIDDVAAVLRDGRADAGFDQLLDLVDDVRVLGIFVEVRVGDMNARGAAWAEQRRRADEMVKQRLEHQRLEVAPRNAGGGSYRYEVTAEENAFDHAAVEQSAGEWRSLGGFGIREIAGARFHDGLARQELAGGGVRRLLGTDQHGCDVGRRGRPIKTATSDRRAERRQ